MELRLHSTFTELDIVRRTKVRGVGVEDQTFGRGELVTALPYLIIFPK